jgi:hypothetical protein
MGEREKQIPPLRYGMTNYGIEADAGEVDSGGADAAI